MNRNNISRCLLIYRNLMKGKTLFRITQNIILENIKLSGRILDVAGGSKPSYRTLLTAGKNLQWDVADYQDSPGLTYSFDANKPWPIESEQYDNVILMNSIYIFEDPVFVLKEASRTLKKSGLLVIGAPFLWPECPEPLDYRRYTLSGLATVLINAGFDIVWMKTHGGMFSVSVEMLRPIFRKLFIYPPLACLCQILDVLSCKVTRNSADYYFGSVIVAKK